MSRLQVNLLALETSGKSGSVAILQSDSLATDCTAINLSDQWGSAKTLAPAIKELLSQASMVPSDLNAIALVTGPGSFTGLRVGVATAKAMAYALKIPIVEVDTLDAIASQNLQHPQTLHVILDAYRGQVFYAPYSILAAGYSVPTAGSFLKLAPTAIKDIEELIESIAQDSSSSSPSSPSSTSGSGSGFSSAASAIYFVGPGCARLQKQLLDPEAFGGRDMRSVYERCRWIETGTAIPQAESVARLGMQLLHQGKTVEPMAIMPHYYRASAAEEANAQSEKSV